MTQFTELLRAIAQDGEHYTATVSDDWLQGRTAYGGLAAALCLEAALRQTPDLPPLRSAQLAFVGPASGVLTIRPAMLRRGKSTAFVGVDLMGEAGLATRATFCFGAPRASTLAHPAPRAADVPRPEQCENFFKHAPPGLNFTSHFDGRLAAGHIPFSRTGEPDMTLWLRHRDPDLKPSMVALLALADAPPPATLVLFEKAGPISTMTWTVDIAAETIATDDEGWWLVRTSAEYAGDGYSGQKMGIWNAAGEPVLLARQNVAVFV